MFTRVLRAVQMRSHATSGRRHVKILASDAIEQVCGDTFRKRGHELTELAGIKKDEILRIIHEFDGLVVRSGTKVSKDIIDAGVNLKIIGRAGSGVDNIDVRAATAKGILVANTPGGNTVSTAELALSHIMALARSIPQATASLKAGRWDRSMYTGSELTGKTLGVIGMGKVGREVARLCGGLGMTTIGYDPVLSEQAARNLGIEPVLLEDLLRTADFITIHTPLTKETQHLFNAETLAQTKRGVRIVNCARGGIIDEAALLAALESGQVAGAALDVLEMEPPGEDSLALRKHPRVVVTPHLGASTIEAQERVAKAVAENMCDIFDGGSFVGVVNAPDLGAVAALKHVVPFVALAEHIGSLQGQLLLGNKVGSVAIHLRGRDVSTAAVADVLKAAVVKGLLTALGIEQVSLVNASAMAEDIGLKVVVNMSEQTDASSGFMNALAVELEVGGMLNTSRWVEGTVFGRDELRITQVDGFALDLPPGEHMLMFNNLDQPGVLRGVADQLAGAGVNIAHFSLGRKDRGKLAMGAVVVDSAIPKEVVASLAKNADIKNVVAIHLKESADPNFRVRSGTAGGDGQHAGSQGHVAGGRKPTEKPRHPHFSSGPCKKRPGYELAALRTDTLGRSHRSKLGKARLGQAIEETKRILGVPQDYLCAIVPGSDTGAFEMAMWSMLGARPVDVCYWESFGKGWNDDIVKHLGLKETTRSFSAEYGQLPDLAATNPDHDVVFTFNGTTSGVRVPNLDWVSADRQGLTFNDATSAAFAMQIDWPKVDVTTFSWQKVLGGEGAHGVLILSPRAVERLRTFDSKRPLPKVFRMTKKNKDGTVDLDRELFEGSTINTPSMLCVEDYLDALRWSDTIGGLPALIKRSQDNLAVLEGFTARNDWMKFLAADPAVRSNTSVCLTLPPLTPAQVKTFIGLLEAEGVAYDIGAYRDAPAGLRIWCGATIEREDLEALLPWLQWAFEAVQKH